ncbi:MAG: DUF1273 family protein [Clostridia bacterium]|nr:DUF1273 family protein [Clostridia bacterium]
METHKTCSFIGHREIENGEEIKSQLKSLLIKLINNNGVKFFLFGSRSDFNSLCHLVVTELKERYPHIQRRAYTCRSESCILEKDRAYWKKVYSQLVKHQETLLCFEQEVEHKTKWTSGKAQYVERNQAMIDDSDFCIFYYNKNYNTPTKTNSGTKIAYEYALKKNKKIINLFE